MEKLKQPINSDHRHNYIKPKGRLSDHPKGLFFLIWECECGKEKAADLLPREKIEELAKKYKERMQSEQTNEV